MLYFNVDFDTSGMCRSPGMCRVIHGRVFLGSLLEKLPPKGPTVPVALVSVFFCCCDETPDMTKSSWKNEELALAYSSRGGAHNAEEDMESGIQSRKLAVRISSHRKPWTWSRVRLYKLLKPTSLTWWSKAPCSKIPPSPQTPPTGSQILKCVSLWGAFFIQIAIVVSLAGKRMWSSEKLRNCLMSCWSQGLNLCSLPSQPCS